MYIRQYLKISCVIIWLVFIIGCIEKNKHNISESPTSRLDYGGAKATQYRLVMAQLEIFMQQWIPEHIFSPQIASEVESRYEIAIDMWKNGKDDGDNPVLLSAMLVEDCKGNHELRIRTFDEDGDIIGFGVQEKKGEKNIQVVEYPIGYHRERYYRENDILDPFDDIIVPVKICSSIGQCQLKKDVDLWGKFVQTEDMNWRESKEMPLVWIPISGTGKNKEVYIYAYDRQGNKSKPIVLYYWTWADELRLLE